MNITVKTIGVEAVQKALMGASAVVRTAVDNAVQAEAMETASEARVFAPKKTSTLARSIVPQTLGPASARVFTNVVYAARQEFGFVGADRLGRVYNQAGKLYMTRAAENARHRLPGRIEAAVKAVTQ